MGAWIETTANVYHPSVLKVAPRVGAWIETIKMTEIYAKVRSRLVWARGLKRTELVVSKEKAKSRLVWARGLKRSDNYPICPKIDVAPRVGAWIETDIKLI